MQISQAVPTQRQNPTHSLTFLNFPTSSNANNLSFIQAEEIIDLLWSLSSVSCSHALKDKSLLEQELLPGNRTDRERMIIAALLNRQIKVCPIFGDFVFNKLTGEAVLILGKSGFGKSLFAYRFVMNGKNSNWDYGDSDGLFIVSFNGEQFITSDNRSSYKLSFRGPSDSERVETEIYSANHNSTSPLVFPIRKVLVLQQTSKPSFGLVRDIAVKKGFDPSYFVSEWFKYDLLEEVQVDSQNRIKVFDRKVEEISLEI